MEQMKLIADKSLETRSAGFSELSQLSLLLAPSSCFLSEVRERTLRNFLISSQNRSVNNGKFIKKKVFLFVPFALFGCINIR